ncbi:protocadherin beta-13-like [Saccostrea cucullata]|uniref:protocadherin beta-13-like n=1 Tax=Saccostrea cuccullata TaxID=36930 RepID=UPI002ED02967
MSLNFLISLGILASISTVKGQLHYKLPEEKPPDFYLGNVANDTNLWDAINDETIKRSMRFSFLSHGNQYSAYFRISSTSSDLFTASKLDRESLEQCEYADSCVLPLEIIAQSSVGTFFRKITVYVDIQDINDNPPKFISSTRTIAVSEASDKDTSFPLDGAVDNDLGMNSIQKYYLIPDDTPFSIKFTKIAYGRSTLALILNGSLDRESVTFYTILIQAVDGGSPKLTGTQTLYVNVTDANDNRPKFSQPMYNVTVDEDAPPGSTIIKLSATDDDIGPNGQVTYKLSPYQSEDIFKKFQIDPVNGYLTLIKSLKYEPDEVFRIIVDATDMAQQPLLTQTTVNVKVNDARNNPPQININLFSSPTSAKILESTTKGVAVAHVAVVDDDTGMNGIVNCSIEIPEFELQKLATNEYKVNLAKPLNREAQDRYEVEVVCTDAGTPSLNSSSSFVVDVLDVNDNAPQFSETIYRRSVRENNRFGEIVLKVSATDADIGNNSKIVYSLDQIGMYDFVIDSGTGEVSANFIIDRESTQEINFKVVATDMGNPPLSSVANVNLQILDHNDHKPEFLKPLYKFTVRENLPGRTLIGQVEATDKDTGSNANLKYSVVTNTGVLPIFVAENGYIFSKEPLDREAVPHGFHFQVIVTDGGEPVSWNSTCFVTVFVEDVNDNGPDILFPNNVNYTISFLYDIPINSVIGRIRALDIDYGQNSALSYSFIGSDIFSVHADKGDIYVTRQLSPQDIDRYTLTVIVEDQGTPKRSKNQTLVIIVTSHLGLASPREKPSSDTYMLIAVVISCVTVVLGGFIILVIFLIRRHDRNKHSSVQNTPKTLHNDIKMYDVIDRSARTMCPRVVPSEDGRGSASIDLSVDTSQDQLLGERNSIQSNQSEEEIEKILERITPVPSNYTRSSRSSSVASQPQFAQIRSSIASKSPSITSMHRGSSSRSSHGHMTKDPNLLLRPDICNISQPKSVSQNPQKVCDDDSETSVESNTSDSGRGGSESDVQTGPSTIHKHRELGSTRSLKIVYQSDTNHRLKRHLSEQTIPIHDIHSGPLAASEDQEYIIIKNPHYCPRPQNNSSIRDNDNQSHDRKFKQKPSVHWNPVTRVLQGSVATIDERDDVSSTTSGSYTVELEDMTSREYAHTQV